jgi:hypothetical protein
MTKLKIDNIKNILKSFFSEKFKDVDTKKIEKIKNENQIKYCTYFMGI